MATMNELPTITDALATATKPNCEVCFGEGLVCESHPMRPWEAGTPADCACGAPGMPCACTGMQGPLDENGTGR
jgi:hypothetical protein